MKFTKIFSLVALAHLALFLILVQPGCQSIERAWEEQSTARETVEVAEQDRVPTERRERDIPSDFNRGVGFPDGTATAMRARPMRPGTERTVSEREAPPPDILNAGVGAPDFSDLVEMDSDWESEPAPGSQVEGRTHTVARGESLWSISRNYGVSFQALLDANRMDRNTRLRVGQEIIVPRGGDPVRADRADPAPVEPGAEYTVARGDTLSHIAQRHGTSVSAIRQANQLTGDTIRVGQTLVIPGAGEAVPPRRTETTQRTRTAPGTPPEGYTGVHVVERGEFPATIAAQYGMRTNELLEINQISDPRRMRVGQELWVRDTTGVEGEPSRESPKLRDEASAETTPRERAAEETPAAEPDERAPVILEDDRPVRIIESDEADFEDFGFGEDDLLDLEGDLPVIEAERVEEN